MNLLTELNVSFPKPIVYVDNKSAIQIAKYPKQDKNSKHIDVRHHFVRDYIEKDMIGIEWKSGKEMIADMFTKPLGKTLFTKYRDEIGVTRNSCQGECEAPLVAKA